VVRIDEQIRRARRESGFSQEALAERIGVPPAELSGYEDGERISSRHLELIAVATGKPVSFFLDQPGSAERNGTGIGGRLRAALAWVSAAPAVDTDGRQLLAEVASRESALAEHERRLARRTAALEERERALQALEAQLETKADVLAGRAVGEPRRERETNAARAARPAGTAAAGINLDALEHTLDERAGDFPEQEPEWRAYIVFLREFVHADGELPPTFNTLVREVFHELLVSPAAD
jgi:transcriptional regulator with XRE-family HTH domain